MARLVLVLLGLLVALRVLLLFKVKPEVSTRHFRLSTLQIAIALAVVIVCVAAGPKGAFMALLFGLAAIVSISFLPDQKKPR